MPLKNFKILFLTPIQFKACITNQTRIRQPNIVLVSMFSIDWMKTETFILHIAMHSEVGGSPTGESRWCTFIITSV